MSQSIAWPDHGFLIGVNTDDTDTDDPTGDDPANKPTRNRNFPKSTDVVYDTTPVEDVEDPNEPEILNEPQILIEEVQDHTPREILVEEVEAPHTRETEAVQDTRREQPADGSPVSPQQTPTAETNIVSPPQGQTPPTPVPVISQPIRVTEYMVRDFSGGVSRLPQWIELHNPNAETVNLKGWKFQYATRRFANDPYKIYQLTLAAFRIAGGGTAILTTRRLPLRQFSGIEATEVYNLNIENVLKTGWVLIDATGSEVQRIGKDAFRALTNPVAPPHQNWARVSHHAYRSESPSEGHYYGHRIDVGSPGFYEQPVPAAPSAPHRKKIGLWGELRKADN